MLFAGSACGQISDRIKRPNLILTVCMIGAMVSLVMLTVSCAGVAASLAFDRIVLELQ